MSAIKWLVIGTFGLFLFLWLTANLGVAIIVGFIAFILGLLIIIAISVMDIANNTSTFETKARTGSTATHETDADLFEEFDDPYDEPAPTPQKTVRVNPRRKHRV
ncbi:hypothetical protein BH09CHL1_BH09CHL1_17210 [soil metagenome]